MPKRQGAKHSKRQTSSNRHKIERKKRENKRDLKKAAKAMRSSGLRIRPKKNREKAKLALNLSSKDPNKELALNNLLRARERAKIARQEKRQRKKEEAQAIGQEAFNEQQDPNANWMRPVSANQLERQERLERREQYQQRLAEDASRGVRRFMAFPPGTPGAGTAECQLRKIINSMRDEVPIFLITLDARCALESVPWSLIDDVVADAVAVHTTEQEQQQEQQKQSSSSTTSRTIRRVFFALTRADLVTADALVTGAVAVSKMIKERYFDNEPLVAKLVKFNIAAACSTAFAPNINYIYKALNSVIAEIVAERRRRIAHGDDVKLMSTTSTNKKKDINKVVFCVFGYPNTGKTSLEVALIKKATTSACAIAQATNLQEIAVRDEPRRFHLDDTRILTLLNVGESKTFNTTEIVAGDILFHKHATPEKMAHPEVPAQKLLEGMDKESFNTICRAFGQPGSIDGKNFLVNLGRCIRRENGFYTPHGGDSAVVPQIAQGIFASSVEGSSKQPTLRAFHAAPPQKRDGPNALRIGARIFIHEFCRGDAGLRWHTNELPSTVKKSGEEFAKCLGSVFSSNNQFSSVEQVEQATAAKQAAAASPSRRRQRSDNKEENNNNTTLEAEEIKERGLNVVVGLQQIAQALPLANAGTTGLKVDAALVSPQTEIELTDDIMQDQAVPEDAEQDDFDDAEFDEEFPEDFFDFDEEEEDDLDDDEEDVPPPTASANKKKGSDQQQQQQPKKKLSEMTLAERAEAKKAMKLSPSRWDEVSSDELDADEGNAADFWMPEEDVDEDEIEGGKDKAEDFDENVVRGAPSRTAGKAVAAAAPAATKSKKAVEDDMMSDDFDDEGMFLDDEGMMMGMDGLDDEGDFDDESDFSEE